MRTYADCIDALRNALLDLSAIAERDKFPFLKGTIWNAHKMIDVLKMLLRTHNKV